jgi:ligand-binding SRPBCC domain-containing protein
MPHFESVTRLLRPVAEVFEFFCRPANLLKVTPADLGLRLLEGPERLRLGSRLTLEGRRWGIPQRILTEVTTFEPDVLIVDEQRQGPFRKWVHSHRFEPLGAGTKVTERIEFEPPGGMLGLVVTAGLIERHLRQAFAYRSQKLEELLGLQDSDHRGRR